MSPAFTQLDDTNYQSWMFNTLNIIKLKGLHDHIKYNWIRLLELQEEIDLTKTNSKSQSTSQSQMPTLSLTELERELTAFPKYLHTAIHEQSWSIGEDRAISIISLSLSSKFHSLAKTATSAYQLWKDLADENKTTTMASKITIKHKFNTCLPDDGETILQFMDRLVIMRQQLSEVGSYIDEIEVVYRVLGVASLNYGPIVMACCTIPETQLNVARIRAYFTMEQTTRQTNDSNEQALYTNYKHKHASNSVPTHTATDSNRSKCAHCGYWNHKTEDCRAPEWKRQHYKTHRKPYTRDSTATANKAETEPDRQHNLESRSNASYALNSVAYAFPVTATLIEETPIAHTKTSLSFEQAKIASENQIKDYFLYLDSGCTQHMVNNVQMLINCRPANVQVFGAVAHQETFANVKGELSILTNVNNKTSRVIFKDVIYVPNFSKNLISIHKITEMGGTVNFYNNYAEIKINNQIIIKGTKTKNNLWKIDQIYDVPKVQTNAQHVHALKVNINTWHQRLGHLSERNLKKLLTNNMLNGLNFNHHEKLDHCDSCARGKQTRLKIAKTHSTPRSHHIGEVIHTDLGGPMEMPSIGGAKYYLTFLDDYSRMSFIYFIKEKSETFEKFKVFRSIFEKQNDVKIKTLQSDGGGEYIANVFKQILKRKGIVHHKTPAHTPQLNGLAERLNRTLMDKTRCILKDAKMPDHYWAEAMNTANYMRNISPTKILGNITPEEKYSGVKPDISRLRVWGSKCFYTVNTYKKKLQDRAREAILVGYHREFNCYKLLDIKSRKMIKSRDVTFQENLSPYEEDEDSPTEVRKSQNNIPTIQDDSDFFEINQIEDHFPANPPGNDKDKLADQSSDSCTKPRLLEESVESSDSETVLREVLDFANEADSDSEEHMQTQRKSSRLADKQKVNYSKLHKGSVYLSIGKNEPSTYHDAMQSNDSKFWLDAINCEIQSLNKMNTWDVVDRPANTKPIRSKWVFKIKTKADGSLDKYKARVVGKGFTQKKGIDYNETFSPVVKFESIRYINVLAFQRNWETHHMDVKTAFLNGKLEEVIYMLPPEGITIAKGKVLKLNRSIYGLKQSSRCWNDKFTNTLQELGFRQTDSDPCLFVNEDGNVVIGVYVDDLIITGERQEIINTKSIIASKFEMTDLGLLTFILGVNFRHDGNSLTIDQTKYTYNLLHQFNMQNCKGVSTPMVVNNEIDNSDPLDKNVPYREAVGGLNYLSTQTRPDISFAVNQVAKKMHSPSKNDWIAVKRIFRYLKHTHGMRLLYNKNGENIEGYSDASYASGDDRKSISGYFFTRNGGAISWRSKKQPIISLSSMEAEYIAMTAATQEAIWLSRLEKDLRKPSDEQITMPMKINEDNQSAITLASNKIHNDRSKHIDVRYHFIREKIKNKDIKLEYCQTTDMIADIFTKPLGNILFEKHRKSMGLIKMEIPEEFKLDIFEDGF
jgi:transposase InsO family protein